MSAWCVTAPKSFVCPPLSNPRVYCQWPKCSSLEQIPKTFSRSVCLDRQSLGESPVISLQLQPQKLPSTRRDTNQVNGHFHRRDIPVKFVCSIGFISFGKDNYYKWCHFQMFFPSVLSVLWPGLQMDWGLVQQRQIETDKGEIFEMDYGLILRQGWPLMRISSIPTV